MDLKQLEIVSFVVIVATAIVFILVEKRRPYNRGYRTFRPEFWSDLLFYGIAQSYIMGLLISRLIYFIDAHFWTRYGLDKYRIVATWPLWLQVLFFLVTHDLVTYFIHRTQHRSKWLWRTHEAHHATKNVDWLSGIKSHPLEVLLYETAKFLPVILLGARPEVPLYRAMIDATYGMWIHSNLDIRLGPLLWVFNGPELHRWHHANCDTRAYDKNFGTKFAVWDHLFGTVFNPADGRADDYGLTDVEFPAKGYWRQIFFCFRSARPPVAQTVAHEEGLRNHPPFTRASDTV